VKVKLAKTLPQEDLVAKMQDWMDGETKINAYITDAECCQRDWVLLHRERQKRGSLPRFPW